MLRRRGWILLIAATSLAAAMSPGPAYGQPGDDCIERRWVVTGEDENGNPTYGWRNVNVCEDGGDDGGTSAPSACQHDDPEIGEVPCIHDVYGWWSSSYDCYVSLAEDQPPEGDEAWEGNDPEDGAIYVFYCPEVIGGVVDWSARNGFLAQAPNVPSVADIAQQAMESLPLVGANIGIAPSPDGVGLVGIPVWLWTEDTDATWGPVSVSVPGPGITVTAEANAVEIEWDMGNGHVEVCDGPGVPYQASFGGREPDCGYTYPLPSSTRPDGRYTITATTTWEVDWWVEPRGSAEEGQDSFVRVSEPVSIQINELQVVTG